MRRRAGSAGRPVRSGRAIGALRVANMTPSNQFHWRRTIMFSFNNLKPAAPYWLFWIVLGLTTTTLAAEPQRLVSRARERAQSPALAAAVVTSRSIDVYVSGVARLGWPGRVDEDDAF